MSCLSKSHKACTTDAIVKDDGSDTITCANCGEKGHVYRYCYKPVISYGIICFRYNSCGPEYLILHDVYYVKVDEGGAGQRRART